MFNRCYGRLALLLAPVQVFGADANVAQDGEFTDPMLWLRDFGWTSPGQFESERCV